MTTLRLAGVKGYISNGTPYFYLRATGKRIVDLATGHPIDPVKQPEAFAARVAEMKAELDARPQPAAPRAGTLLALYEAWRGAPGKVDGTAAGRPRRAPSLEWLALKPATRKSYERILDPETGYIRRGTRVALDRVQLLALDTPNVVKIRDKVARRFGFWTGNYSVKVLRTMFRWGKLHGHLKSNPAAEVPMLPRPDDMAPQHRPWADAEFTAMLEAAREKQWDGVVLALGLGRYAGWPIGDIVHQPPTVWQDPRLVWKRKKSRRGRMNSIKAPAALRAILLEIDPDQDADTLVTNAEGEPYTEDGLRTMIWKLGADLARKGKVKPGLNIHGLRHSLGKELYDLGLEREARKAMLAHESDAASKVYERDGDRSAQADKAVVALNRHRANKKR